MAQALSECRKMKKTLFAILLIGFLNSCAFGEKSLDNMNSLKLTFNELPTQLKDIYKEKALIEMDTFYYEVKSLDKEFDIEHYWTGMSDRLLTKGHNHHFVINGMEFKLRANQGDPFILRNKKLYYTEELNLREQNFEKAVYIEIDLAKCLNKKVSR